MSAPVPNRTIAGSSVAWGVWRVEAGNTTGRWRDKKPRGAASVGRVVSMGYTALSRGALFSRTSRARRFFRDFICLTRCAESRR